MAHLLLKRLKKGDMSAFDEIYNSNKKKIYYAIYLIVKDEMTTEDLMQEVFMDFLDYYQNLKDDVSVEAFLVASAKNKAINYYNRRKREEEFALTDVYSATSKDRLLDTGLLEKIRETLKDKEYDIFVLHVLGEYSFKEISEMLDIPIGTLTWSYQEARKKLLDVFKEEEDG